MRQNIFHPVHLRATLFLVMYLVLSKVLFVWLVAMDQPLLPFIIATSFSAFFGVLFLYMFSHEDFFSFAKDLEKKERKSEKKWERKFLHYGKITTVFAISVIGGPIFAALAIRFLLKNYKYKYALMIAASVFASTLTWLVAKGVVSIFI